MAKVTLTEGLKEYWRELKQYNRLPKGYNNKPITQKEFVNNALSDIKRIKTLNATRQRELTRLIKNSDNEIAKASYEKQKTALKELSKSLTKMQKNSFQKTTYTKLQNIIKESSRIRKNPVTTREKINRLGVSHLKMVRVNGKNYTFEDIVKYLSSKNIDILNHFLGESEEYSYSAELQLEKSKNYSSIIKEIEKNNDVDPDVIKATKLLMFGDVMEYSHINNIKGLLR